ncbi:hypothetical protein BaRGS_00025657 [Batillaria attramentaria]|uniref:Uncharacterized protein n=1 Tax=Batillaria attramentaria TaxID=370345 RepID=A0ABD0K7E0_9CAEN
MLYVLALSDSYVVIGTLCSSVLLHTRELARNEIVLRHLTVYVIFRGSLAGGLSLVGARELTIKEVRLLTGRVGIRKLDGDPQYDVTQLVAIRPGLTKYNVAVSLSYSPGADERHVAIHPGLTNYV